MLSALFTSVADALISYAIDKLDPAERIKSWLRLDPARLAFKKALARAYSAFARQYPEYISSLFDQSFLSTDALPELSKLLTRNQHPDPALLAQAWGRSLGAGADFAQAATKPASYFLERFEAELKAESALQSLFDSRTLESLPKLEAEIQKLSADLQRGLDEALKAATDYQKVTLHIGGDVKNSNIVIGNNNNVINNYYYTGDFIALNEYYIPPDGVFQRVRTDDFIGRDWLTAKVDAFLNDPNRKSGAFLLIGDAGVGKTSFMAHLVKERRYLHLFAEQVPGQAMLQRAMQSLGSQLVTRYQIDPYKDRDTLNALSVFPDFLERILRLAASTLTEGEKIVIVCDALDEAGTFPDHFVFGLPKELPDGVYFILSQRPVNVKLPNFEPVIEKLEAQGEGNLQDIEAYLSAVAKRPEVAGQIRSKEYSEDFFIQTLKEKSQGVWMYLHYIIKEIESGARAPLDLANLPTGLVGYYAEHWDAWRTGKRGKGEEAWDDLYAPLLTTLAAAQEAIPVDWLIQWSGVNVKPREVTRLLTEHWRAFITEKEKDGQKAYTPYHLSFKDFITGRADTNQLPPTKANLVKDLDAQTMDAHKRIVNVFEKECNGEWEKLVEQDYPRLHLTAHLNGAGEYEKLRVLLTEDDEKIKWAKARENKEETYSGYLKDLTYAWDYAEQNQNYALAIRCMLIENSLRGMGKHLSSKTIAEIVKSGALSLKKGLSIIETQNDDWKLDSFFEDLIPDASQTLLNEIYAATNRILDEDRRSRILIKIISYLPDQMSNKILEDLHITKNKRHYIKALSKTNYQAGNLDTQQIYEEALNISFDMGNVSDKLECLSYLIPILPDRLRYKAFQDILGDTNIFQNKQDRAKALHFFIPYLSPKKQKAVVGEILSAAIDNYDISFYFDELKSFAPMLSENLKLEVLKEASVIAEKVQSKNQQAQYLITLISLGKSELIEKALKITKSIKNVFERTNTLISLVPYLKGDLKKKIVSEIFRMGIDEKDGYLHDISLVSLFPHFSNQEKRIFLLAVKEDKFSLHNMWDWKEIIANLHNNALIPDALSIIQNLGYKSTEILKDINPLLPDELKVQIIDDVIPNISKSSLSGLSKLEEGLAPHLSKSYKMRLLNIAKSTSDLNYRTSLLRTLATAYDQEFEEEILPLVFNLNSKYSRANILSILTQKLGGDLKEKALAQALSDTQELNDFYLLSKLVPQLNDERKSYLLSSILTHIENINNESKRWEALIYFLPIITGELAEQVIPIIRNFKNADHKIDAISYFSENLKNEDKGYAISLMEENRTIIDTHLYVFHRVIASGLNDDCQKRLYYLAKKIRHKPACAEALLEITPYLNDILKNEAVNYVYAIVNNIKNIRKRLYLLSLLIPHLNGEHQRHSINEILKKVNKFIGSSFRAEVLFRIAPYLNDELKAEILDLIKEFERGGRFVIALDTLAPYLTEKLKEKTISNVLETKHRTYGLVMLVLATQYANKEERIKFLKDALDIESSLPSIFNAWKEIDFEGLENFLFSFIKKTSSLDRSDGFMTLNILTPALIHFRGPAIADELYRTITDVTRWWP